MSYIKVRKFQKQIVKRKNFDRFFWKIWRLDNLLLKFPDLYHHRKIHDEWSVDKSSTHLSGRQAKNGFCEWLAYMMDNGLKSILKQNSYFELLPALSQDTHKNTKLLNKRLCMLINFEPFFPFCQILFGSTVNF